VIAGHTNIYDDNGAIEFGLWGRRERSEISLYEMIH
jgi:hypothetical protein